MTNDNPDLLRIEYVPLSQALLWDRNPKRHDIPELIESIERHGFKDPPKFEPTLNSGRGGFVEGNGRTVALRQMRKDRRELPRGIVDLGDDWAIPVLFGVDAPSQRAAEAYGVDHNMMVLSGAEFGLQQAMRIWDPDVIKLLDDLVKDGQRPISIDDSDVDALLTDYDVPELSDQPDPTLPAEHFVEIYCTDDDLREIRPTLSKWSKRKGVTVNIS